MHAQLGAVITGILVAGLLSLTARQALGEMSQEELAKLMQNPIGSLISVPFQNNTNFDVGPKKGTQNILNLQPVTPVELNQDWNLVTRTIMPIISQPRCARLRRASGPHARITCSRIRPICRFNRPSK